MLSSISGSSFGLRLFVVLRLGVDMATMLALNNTKKEAIATATSSIGAEDSITRDFPWLWDNSGTCISKWCNKQQKEIRRSTQYEKTDMSHPYDQVSERPFAISSP